MASANYSSPMDTFTRVTSLLIKSMVKERWFLGILDKSMKETGPTITSME